MRLRWLNQTPPLSPPPSESELRWWNARRLKVGFTHVLRVAVPFVLVWTVIDLLTGRGGVHLFVVVPLLSLFAGLATWAAGATHYRSQYIRWKRVRDDLGVPAELP